MDEIKQFQRKADEAQDLFHRFLSAYPQKRGDQADLKKRWEQKDPNVVKWDHGEGEVEYRLEFTDDQKKKLIRQYLLAHPDTRDAELDPDALGSPEARFRRDHISSEARILVGVIENWGDRFDGRVIQNQKERKRKIEQIANKLEGLDQVLAELDPDALGYWYANVVDALAKAGYQISEADNRLTSMLNNPMRAIVEAGEFRQTMRKTMGEIVAATNTAANNIPNYERTENDPRLQVARGLEQQLVRSRMPFETTETGFAATCLRAIFDLAGVEVEKVSYWLKKAEEHPDSETRFLQRMRERAQG